MQKQFKAGKLTEEQAKARIVNLRSQVRKPEDIERDDVLSILDVISEDSLEQFIQEQEYFKNEAVKQIEENIHLKETLELKEIELESKNKEALQLKNETIQKESENVKKILLAKESLLREKDIAKQDLISIKESIEKEASSAFFIFKFVVSFSLILLYVFVCLIIWKMGWSIIEVWTYVAAVLFSNFVPVIYLLISENNLNLKKYLSKRKKRIYIKTFDKFRFDIERLKTLEKEILELSNEIEEIEKSSTQTVSPIMVSMECEVL